MRNLFSVLKKIEINFNGEPGYRLTLAFMVSELHSAGKTELTFM